MTEVFVVQMRRYVPYEVDYTVVVGAFSSEEKAEEYTSTLETKDTVNEEIYYETLRMPVQ